MDRQIPAVLAQFFCKSCKIFQFFPDRFSGCFRDLYLADPDLLCFRIFLFIFIRIFIRNSLWIDLLPQFPGTIYPTVLFFLEIPFIGSDHPCHFIIRHPDHRGTQNSCHRNILHRIIDHRQKAEYGFHFRCCKISGPCLGSCRYSFIHQNIYKDLRPATHTAQQDHHILIAGFSVTLPVLIPHIQTVFFICKAFDLFCDHFCFQFPGCIICCLFV